MNSAHGYTEGADNPQQPQVEKTDNELIAEFMGFNATETHNLHGVVYSHPDLMGVYGDKAQEFKYHKSWDWLMPVVEKIEKTKGTCVFIETQTACFITSFGKVVARGKDAYTKIGSIYKAVVEFIKWYNAQPKQL